MQLQKDRDPKLLPYQDGFDRRREADRESRRKLTPFVAWIAFEGSGGTFIAAVVFAMMVIALSVAIVLFFSP